MTQGSVDAAIVSSANVAGGVEEFFNDSSKEIKMEEVDLAPMSFVDDIGKLSNNIEAAQYGNDRMEELVDSKTLSLNLQKSAFLVIGSQKNRKKIQSQLRKTPLLLRGNPMQEQK